MVHVAKDITVVNPTPWMPWVRVACPPATAETAQVARPQVPLVQRRGTWSCEEHPAQGLLVGELHTATHGLSARLGLGLSLET